MNLTILKTSWRRVANFITKRRVSCHVPFIVKIIHVAYKPFRSFSTWTWTINTSSILLFPSPLCMYTFHGLFCTAQDQKGRVKGNPWTWVFTVISLSYAVHGDSTQECPSYPPSFRFPWPSFWPSWPSSLPNSDLSEAMSLIFSLNHSTSFCSLYICIS